MDYISQFIKYLEHERCLSPNTVRLYQNNLIEFKEYLGKSKFSIRAVKRKQIRGFLFSLAEKNNQPITRRLKQTTLRTFFSFLADENIIKDNPTKNLPMPKVEMKEPSYLTEAEIKKLINTVEKDDSKYASRNLLMVKLLAETGIRLNELTGLNVGDVNAQEKTIKVKRKGNKEQSLPINDQLNKELKIFIKDKESAEPLLVSNVGKRITNRRAGLLIQKFIKDAGIDKPNISAHSLRHGYCVRLLEKGVNLKSIQLLCGHSSISTTERYLHISKNELRKEVKLAQIKD